jgi:myo-inositol-1(or 4)-monophosphatase
MREKSAADLVSEADTGSERVIVDAIRSAFPDHAILAEEEHVADVDAEHLWIVDPLDGTTNFAHGLDHFSVSIAYYRDGVAECGVVHVPLRDEWYTAARGQGAYHGERPIRVASEDRLADVLIGVGFYYDRDKRMEATLAAIRDLFRGGIHGIRRFRLIVEEAGGRVTTCGGDPLPISSSTLLASNGRLHEAMLAIVTRHEP